MLKVVFMGTPDFAVPCLQAILEGGYDVRGVFTQPDKPKGRKYILTSPPVKDIALQNGIPVFQPIKMKDSEALSVLRQLSPDIIVVVAYGKVLPQEILAIPRLGCINVHASLLPRYRGAAPIQWSVINGEQTTGVTTMQMDAGLDTGDILLVSETKIAPDETSGELYQRLSVMGAELLIKTLEAAGRGTLCPVKQDEAQFSYAPMLDKSLSPIDWNKPADVIHNQIRGLSPWPAACCQYQGKTLKIHKAKLGKEGNGAVGEIISTDPLLVVCGDLNTIEPIEVQYEGGKRLAIADFLRGRPMTTGDLLT